MERTFTELIKTAHEHAKAGGWWDTERNTGELLMLIVSECGEALEAHRNEKRADMESWSSQYTGRPMSNVNEKGGFETWIKDTFEDELADIVIRIADYIGGTGRMFFGTEPSLVDVKASGNVGEELLKVVASTIDGSSLGVAKAVYQVFGIAAAHNIDLWKHIELKMAYNKTRGYKHGKAY
jgi:NTP pyrophosphatase (non-canonical NTP hydrolase)